MSLVSSIIAIGALGLFVSPALAQPEGLYGNTLEVTTPDGAVIKLAVDKDGTYTRTNPDATVGSGTWAETADSICFTPVKPEPKPAICLHKITQKPGDSWTDQVGGTDLKLTIKAGH